LPDKCGTWTIYFLWFQLWANLALEIYTAKAHLELLCSTVQRVQFAAIEAGQILLDTFPLLFVHVALR
jgi:hypothetical protein